MFYSFSNFIKIVSRVPRRYLVLPFLFAVMFSLVTAAGAAEKLIPGEKKITEGFQKMHERDEIEKDRLKNRFDEEVHVCNNDIKMTIDICNPCGYKLH